MERIGPFSYTPPTGLQSHNQFSAKEKLNTQLQSQKTIIELMTMYDNEFLICL